VAATIYSGIQYYGNEGHGSNGVYGYYNETMSNYSHVENSTSSAYSNETGGDEQHRWLASETESTTGFRSPADDVAIWLLLGGAIGTTLFMFLLVVVYLNPLVVWLNPLRGVPRGNDFDPKTYDCSPAMKLLFRLLGLSLVFLFFKSFRIVFISCRVTVPMNVDYTIHRYGEWVMLLLGESVLSLLIVKYIPSPGYQQVFYCGVVSIALLQYLHFRSQPHRADDHAMRRSRSAGVWFAHVLQLYSIALIVMGTSFKMFLYEQVYEEEGSTTDAGAKDTGHRRTATAASVLFRWLAGTANGGSSGAQSAISTEEAEDKHEQDVAMFYCISLALVWFCMDVMLLLHRGLKKHRGDINRCSWVRCAVVWFLILCRVALVVFMATFWLSEVRPTILSWVGLLCIVLQLVTREAGECLFLAHASEQGEDESGCHDEPRPDPPQDKESTHLATGLSH
jgi:hypothetical protein